MLIKKINLKHFKCFESLTLPLCPLTLLTGVNTSGKSSVLQALVLLHQTMREHEWSRQLMLNGEVIRLGTVADVVDEVHGRDAIEIGVEHSEHWVRWVFGGGGDRNAMSIPIKSIEIAGEARKLQDFKSLVPMPFSPADDNLIEHMKSLTYITAERIGPRDVYALHDRQSTPVVGPKGEYAASVLYSESEAMPQKRHRARAWMRKFFPGFEMEITPVPKVNAITLGLKSSEEAEFHRPTHVGFGITQVFPIVVAAISAHKGDILLIENPEVHLHPAGQATMGQFLATVAHAGVQVMVETHSDHILNGVRRAVKEGRGLAAEDVAIHHFRPRGEDVSQVVSPIMDKSGNIDDWPSGFFDQFDKDSSYFAGWGE